MNIVKEQREQNTLLLKITVGEQDYGEAVEKELRNYKRKANVPGFRPGMVPMGIVRKMYGKHMVAEQSYRTASNAVFEYLQKEKIDYVGDVIPSEEQGAFDFENNTEFEFIFECGVAPEFKVELSEKDELTYSAIQVDEKMHADYRSNFLRRYGRLVDAETVEKDEALNVTLDNGDMQIQDAYVGLISMSEEERAPFIGKKVGDKMEVVKISTWEVVDELEVVEVEHEAPATDVKVRLSGKLPEKYNEYYLFNVSKLPRLEFCRSVVWGNLARGVLAKTRGVRIEDNIFRGSTGTAIHVGAESNWKEGTHAKDLTIARNVIINCGLGAGCQYGASGIAVVIGAPDTKATQLHDGVVIEGNTIIGTGSNACGISIRNAKNIRLKDNRVEQCRQAVETRSVENLIIE